MLKDSSLKAHASNLRPVWKITNMHIFSFVKAETTCLNWNIYKPTRVLM